MDDEAGMQDLYWTASGSTVRVLIFLLLASLRKHCRLNFKQETEVMRRIGALVRSPEGWRISSLGDEKKHSRIVGFALLKYKYASML